jgi:hypothetical protein
VSIVPRRIAVRRASERTRKECEGAWSIDGTGPR